MIKNLSKLVLPLLLILIFVNFPIFAQDDPKVNIYYFGSQGCPHCIRAKKFLVNLEKKHSDIKLNCFEIGNSENMEKVQKVLKALNARFQGIPLVIIGNEMYVGYLDDETSGKKIEALVKEARENNYADVTGSILYPQEENEECPPQDEAIPEAIRFPILGKINLKDLSLPALTVVIGVLDGFNPCAMWALMFLISLLIGMKNKFRMWILGTAFIVTSSFVYFLFLSAWLNFFLILGFILWIRIIVGMISLGAGLYNLREFKTYKAVCKITDSKRQKNFFDRLKGITQRREFLLALLGIVVLAFAVNLVELLCSAGLPAIYTQILSLSKLSTLKYYLYLLLYILFFMIDDLIVFFVAMITLQAIGLQSKYVRYSYLLGGILMLIIGVFLIFKPEFLMFG